MHVFFDDFLKTFTFFCENFYIIRQAVGRSCMHGKREKSMPAHYLVKIFSSEN